jgi:hypothetical protein
MSNRQHDDWYRLFEAHCIGDISDDHAARLAALLRDDAAARKLYLQYMDLNAALAWGQTSPAALGEGSAAASTPAHRTARSGRPRLVDRCRSIAVYLVHTPSQIALSVAAVCIIVLLTALAMVPRPEWRPGDFTQMEGSSIPGRVVAARITATSDCQWDDAGLPVGFGSWLYKGQRVRLLSGIAQITFEGGAVVTLSGAAQFTIDSPGQGSLDRGKLSAKVKEQAVGFTINTPRTVVVDLGTEFGVIVAEDGGEEVHVIRGLVEVAVPARKEQPRRLVAGEALRLPPGPNTSAEELPAKPNLFAESIRPHGDSELGPQLPQQQHPPVGRALTLWLAADGALRRDSLGDVSTWGDMRTGDNQKAHNARQHLFGRRPGWSADVVGGRPGIQFDGDDYLTLSTPSDLGILNSGYEMFIVAQTASPAIQFLIAGGVEDFELHLNGDAGARYIPAGASSPDSYSDQDATGTYADARPHVYAVRVIGGDAQFRGVVSVDGRDSGDLTTRDARSSNDTPLRLGMRFDGSYPLVGALAEVLIYNDHLSEAEREAVSQYLAKKHAIELR